MIGPLNWSDRVALALDMRKAGHSLGVIGHHVGLQRHEVEDLLWRKGDPLQRSPIRLVPTRAA